MGLGKKIILIVSVAIIGIIGVSLIIYYKLDNDKNSLTKNGSIENIKVGYLHACPEFTIDELINNYMGNPEWSKEKSDKGYYVFNVSGNIKYNNKGAVALIQFATDKDNIIVKAYEIDKISQTNSTFATLIFNMCENSRGIKKQTYIENGNSSYEVYIKEAYANNYQGNVLRENLTYVSDHIDYINVDFDYRFNGSEIDTYTYQYWIDGELTLANGSQTIYSKIDNIVAKSQNSSKGEIVIKNNVKIDFNRYLNMISDFKKEMNVNGQSNLKVVFHVDIAGIGFENSKLEVLIPLDGNLITVGKKNNLNH